MINTRRTAIALAVAGTFVFCGGEAFADVGACQKSLQKLTLKFQAKVSKGLEGCADAVRKQIAANLVTPGKGDLTAAAAACEKNLAKIYGTGALVDVTKTNLNALWPDPCDEATLTSLYHLAGTAAPGTNMQFTTDWLLLQTESDAIKMAQQQVPDLLAAMNQAITATSGKKGLTDCSGSPGPGAVFRPNLCRFAPECAEHACNLGSQVTATTSGGGGLQSAPLNLLGVLGFDLGGTAIMNMCQFGGATTTTAGGDLVPNGAMVGGTAGFLYLSGDLSNALEPVCIGGAWHASGGNPFGSCDGSASVCVATVRSEGWCDCTGHGLALNTNFCQDRMPPLTGNDACGAPVSEATSEQYFTQKLGKIVNNNTGDPGSSGAGDCYNLNTTQFKIFMSGGYGTDGYPCTIDDTVIPNPPAAVPMTTGSARAEVKNAVYGSYVTLGQCTGVSPAGGKDCGNGVNFDCCVVDSDCNTGATCTGVGVLDLSTDADGGFPGGGNPGLGCAAYQSSNLSGLMLVGGFPAAGGDPAQTTRDSVTDFYMSCQ